MIDYAGELGLDDQALSRCMVGQAHAQAIEDSLAEGYAIPLNSTPTILINGEKMENPFDYGALTAAIDRLLGESN